HTAQLRALPQGALQFLCNLLHPLLGDPILEGSGAEKPEHVVVVRCVPNDRFEKKPAFTSRNAEQLSNAIDSCLIRMLIRQLELIPKGVHLRLEGGRRLNGTHGPASDHVHSVSRWP